MQRQAPKADPLVVSNYLTLPMRAQTEANNDRAATARIWDDCRARNLARHMPKTYALLLRKFHSPKCSAQIIADARDGNAYARYWIGLMFADRRL